MKILGVRIDNVDMKEALDRCRESFLSDEPYFIVTPNSEIVVKANENDELMDIIENADMVVPDGIGLVIASKIIKNPLKERVTGIDLMLNLISFASENNKTVYLLGGKPSVADKAKHKLLEKYPNLNIVGTHDGYFKGMHNGNFNSEEEKEVVNEISDLRPDFLFVALGAPAQENFINKYKKNLNANILMGVGGSFDVISGEVKRAPKIWQKLGLEWLYRVVKEPWRIKRLGALPVFVINVILKKEKKI